MGLVRQDSTVCRSASGSIQETISTHKRTRASDVHRLGLRGESMSPFKFLHDLLLLGIRRAGDRRAFEAKYSKPNSPVLGHRDETPVQYENQGGWGTE
jgi:hypothetical protein